MSASSLREAELELGDRMVKYRQNPLGFVKYAFPWGEPGFLENHQGPDVWQTDFLTRLGEQVRERNFRMTGPVMPIKDAVSSGHGIGKSVEIAMIFWWIMSTRPDAQGTVTANTFTQLETKTWAATAGDRNIWWGNLAKHGPEKVAGRIVDKLKKSIAQPCGK